MQDPRLHLMVDRERRADLVRHAQRSELVARLDRSRRRRHRSLLERVGLGRPVPEVPAAPAAPEP